MIGTQGTSRTVPPQSPPSPQPSQSPPSPQSSPSPSPQRMTTHPPRRRGFFSMFCNDVKAIFANDPAATSLAEVLLYPGLHAIVAHRVAHGLHRKRVPFVPRLISQLTRFLTGIEIHPGAQIGCGFFIDHGMGVVIGETTVIGNDVTLYQGVTLGGTGKQTGKRHPTIEEGAVIGVGASVLGDITVGTGARVGGGAVVVKDVPPHTTAVGIPARIVAWRDPITGETRRRAQMPDPEGLMLRDLRAKLAEVETRLTDLEDVTNHHLTEEQCHHHTMSRHLWSILDEYEHEYESDTPPPQHPYDPYDTPQYDPASHSPHGANGSHASQSNHRPAATPRPPDDGFIHGLGI